MTSLAVYPPSRQLPCGLITYMCPKHAVSVHSVYGGLLAVTGDGETAVADTPWILYVLVAQTPQAMSPTWMPLSWDVTTWPPAK